MGYKSREDPAHRHTDQSQNGGTIRLERNEPPAKPNWRLKDTRQHRPGRYRRDRYVPAAVKRAQARYQMMCDLAAAAGDPPPIDLAPAVARMAAKMRQEAARAVPGPAGQMTMRERCLVALGPRGAAAAVEDLIQQGVDVDEPVADSQPRGRLPTTRLI